MPEKVRADFIAIQSIVTNVVGLTVALISGLVADTLAGSPYQDTIIVIFRYAAYALQLLDLAILAWPKELPYEKTREKPRLQDIIVLPLRNKKFLLTVGILWLLGFAQNLPAPVLSYHLLNNVGVSYSYTNIVNGFYSLALILLMRPWRLALRKIGWWKLYAFTVIIEVPVILMYSCVTSSNYLWLMTIVRLLQHVVGVGQSLAGANLIYINLPRTDQTNYMAFHGLFSSVSGILGQSVGTAFVAAIPDLMINLFGMSFNNVQVLQWMLAGGQLLVPLLIFGFLKHLQPDDPERIYG
jgi:Na+/melibiose symporter-like transporter